MKTKLLYITIISLLFIIQACKRTEPDCGDLSDVITNYNISDADKAKIPYTGTDTLVFISDAGDTSILIGQGRNSSYETKKYNISGGDCPKNGISNYQNININFISNSTFFSTLNYRIAKTDFAPQTLTGFEIKCNETYRVGGSVENVFYYLPIEDSISINNKFVSGGYIDDEKTLLYNTTIGILKIKFSNKIWIKNN
jgi:hypothetical protein